MLDALEQRGTPYAARIKNNPVLDRLAAPYLVRPVGRPPSEPRLWLHELTYEAQSWSRPRRAVLVVQEREGELLLHHFWLLTNWTQEQMSAPALLELYRERGTANFAVASTDGWAILSSRTTWAMFCAMTREL